jgi:hypothetical protein
MTDRELLELAAKAAGHPIDKSWGDGFSITGDAMLDWHNGKRWNPLRDDGDALRLAVDLRLTGFHIGRKSAWVDPFVNSQITYREDPYAATRRAIVRAAAEIGRAK